MARPLAELVRPEHTAIVTQECQEAVVGTNAGLTALAEEAQREAVPNIARLLPVARAAGVSIIHCVVTRRADGRGSNHNAALFAYGAKTLSAEPGSHGASVVPELGPEPSDLVLTRLHGLGPRATKRCGGERLAQVIIGLVEGQLSALIGRREPAIHRQHLARRHEEAMTRVKLA